MLRTGFVLILLVVALPGPALAEDGPPGPDGLPATSAKHPWKRFHGEPHLDTLSFAFHDVLPAARRQFTTDHWTLFTETAKGDSGVLILTKWKQLHHPLLWIFVGKTMAQYSVQMEPVGLARTRVVFQADLASHHKMEGNPMIAPAKLAYAKAFRKWMKDMTKEMTSVPQLRAGGAGGPVRRPGEGASHGEEGAIPPHVGR